MTHRPSSLSRPRSKLLAIGLAGALLIAACGGDGDGGADTTQVETTPPTVDLDVTTSTQSPDTTTETTIERPVRTTTTIPGVVPVMPLTGLPIVDIHAAGRPAVVVKVDNNPKARPQTGINLADIVYEENVEQLTRFALVFQSTVADPVGPVRSGRTQDVDLLGSLNRPMFIWSGGNGRVTAAINASDLRAISEKAGKPFFRTRDRESPHNLYANVSEVYEIAPFEAEPPLQQFQYRGDDDDIVGPEVAAVKLSMDGVDVLWEWDADEDTFLRFQDGRAHTDRVDDAQVSTDNVVVLFVAYRPSPADRNSPEAQTVGFGEAWVYSGGSVVKGSWVREDRTKPFMLTDQDGEPILLTPGRTFVELARVGKVATVDAGTDIDDVPFP